MIEHTRKVQDRIKIGLLLGVLATMPPIAKISYDNALGSLGELNFKREETPDIVHPEGLWPPDFDKCIDIIGFMKEQDLMEGICGTKCIKQNLVQEKQQKY